MRRSVPTIGGLVVLLAGLTLGTTAASGAQELEARVGIPNAKGVYVGCYSKSTGDLRLVKPRSRCKRSERRVRWSMTGRTGATGLSGRPGPGGAAGPAGAQGVQGLQGLPGLPGAQGDIGPAGPEGLQGLPGLPGAAGPEGAQGPAGPEGSQGPAGPEGPEGQAGPEGPQGPAGPDASQVTFGSAVSSGGNDVAGTPFGPSTASCPAGEIALGGGAIVANGGNAKAAVYLSAPTPRTDGVTPTGWEAQGIITIRTANGQNPTIQAYVVCSA